jgi:hypothetical protein
VYNTECGRWGTTRDYIVLESDSELMGNQPASLLEHRLVVNPDTLADEARTRAEEAVDALEGGGASISMLKQSRVRVQSLPRYRKYVVPRRQPKQAKGSAGAK